MLAGRPMWGLSGFLDPLNRRVESLQRCYGGQDARSEPRGVELRWRTGSPPRCPVEFRWLHGPGSRVQDWGSFLVPRQSYGGVCLGLGHGGEAWSRRRPALCAAELCGRDG